MLVARRETQIEVHFKSEHYPRRQKSRCNSRRPGRDRSSGHAGGGGTGRSPRSHEDLFEGMSPLVQRLRRRDPGVALTHLATLLVDGGDCLRNRAVLRNEPNLFGHVALDFA